MHSGVTGHRGNPEAFAESTLDSFASAIGLGVDWLELDIRLTRDGRLAVIHDEHTGGVGDATLVVAESTYAELAAVDVADGFRRQRGLTLAECPVQRIPLLEDVLRLVLARSAARVSIQPKADCVAEALALVGRLQASAMVGFNDGDLGKLEAVKRHDRRIPIFWDRHARVREDEVATAVACGFECILPPAEHLDGDGIAMIHRGGIQAGVWTVNDPGSMRRFLQLGVDRIYTDRPAALIRLRQELPGA